MTRTMYDSVTATDIPRDAQLVAGYVSGSYRWSAADWARFPNAVKVRIATQASVNDGQVLDVEPGDATPAQAPGWVLKRRAAGVDPTVYCNQLNGWDQVRRAFRDQGVPEPHYWVARYDGKAVIPSGAVAKQYANPTVHGGGHYDLSVVADYWPGIDQPEEYDMDSTQDQRLKDVEQWLQIIATNGYKPFKEGQQRNSPAAGGDLTWFQEQLDFYFKANPVQAQVQVDYDKLAAAVNANVAKAVADELDRRARDGDPTTGPTS